MVHNGQSFQVQFQLKRPRTDPEARRWPFKKAKVDSWGKDLEKHPANIAWNEGEKQGNQIRAELNLPRGTWVAVNAKAEYVTAASETKLHKKTHKLGWFSPYYEEVGIPQPDAIARVAHGTGAAARRPILGRIAVGHGDTNFTTSISGPMRNNTRQTRQCNFTNAFVDDGSTKSSIKRTDVTKTTERTASIPTLHF